MYGGWKRRIGDLPADPFRATPEEPLLDDGACRGLPLGGLGTGSIGRGLDGAFSGWHLTPGAYRHELSPGSWVAVQWGKEKPEVLAAPDVRTRPEALTRRSGGGEYEALFPFSWYRFHQATLRQWSPVIPGRERESAWPAAYIEVTLRNLEPVSPAPEVATKPEEGAREATVAFAFEPPVRESFVNGPITLAHGDTIAVAQLAGGGGGFALGGEATPAVHVVSATLRGEGDYELLGSDLWVAVTELARSPTTAVSPGDHPGLVVAARVELSRGEERTVRFALAWDLPRVKFGQGEERGWWRAHTREFGRSGDASARLVDVALRERADLAQAVERWHAELRARLEGWKAPDWLLPALCNQLSVLVDGGTAWVLSDSGTEEHFGTLECVDYPFFETLDVRYYSSFALLELWPRLEHLVMRDLVLALGQHVGTRVAFEWQGGSAAPGPPGQGPQGGSPPTEQGGAGAPSDQAGESIRKARHAAPHDLGGPDDDAFRRSNAYTLQNTAVWKDLNPKLVPQVVRNATLLDDGGFAAAAWPACREAIAYLERFDRDGDGIPENGGLPDQTYDTWPMTGVSAYCGDLWLACLTAAEWLAGRAGDEAERARLAHLLERAAARFEETQWAGTHYRFDSSGGPSGETILADQLAGTWYSLLLDLPSPHPCERVDRALTTVLRSNFRGFAGGRLGAVNGRSPDGGPAAGGATQASEVWSGVSWAIASLCLLLHRDADAWELGEALYRTIYEESGHWFRTPEAWTERRQFRAQLYHRPLAVWSLYTALRVRSARGRTAGARRNVRT